MKCLCCSFKWSPHPDWLTDTTTPLMPDLSLPASSLFPTRLSLSLLSLPADFSLYSFLLLFLAFVFCFLFPSLSRSFLQFFLFSSRLVLLLLSVKKYFKYWTHVSEHKKPQSVTQKKKGVMNEQLCLVFSSSVFPSVSLSSSHFVQPPCSRLYLQWCVRTGLHGLAHLQTHLQLQTELPPLCVCFIFHTEKQAAHFRSRGHKKLEDKPSKCFQQIKSVQFTWVS